MHIFHKRNMPFLVNLCFKIIICEFARFYFAFKKTNNATLKHHLNFLQRNYSLEIATRLYEIKKLYSEYLEFLLNANLKQLNCHWLNDLNENTLKRLPNLTKISFLWKCQDEHLKIIANHCPQLLELNVKSSHVTDKGIEYLCQSLQLETLFVNFSEVTEKGIKYLIQNLPSLQKVDLNSTIPQLLYTLHIEDWTEARKYNLTSLNFGVASSSPNFINIFKICLAVCPKLKSLEWCLISSQQQLDLFKNLQLEDLDLHIVGQIINTTIFFKNNGFHLSYLRIENCIMSMSDLTISCPKLHSLWITNVTFIDNAPQLIFKCLVKCNMFYYTDDNASTQTIHSILLCSPKLEYIGFTCCNLTRETKTHILQCCENRILKKIFFNYSNVDYLFIANILENIPSPPIIYLNSLLRTIPQHLLRYRVYTSYYPTEYFEKNGNHFYQDYLLNLNPPTV